MEVTTEVRRPERAPGARGTRGGQGAGAGAERAAGEEEGTPEGGQDLTRGASGRLARRLAFTLREVRSRRGF